MTLKVSSSKPKKQRFNFYNMNTHGLHRLVSSRLNKELSKELELRSIPLRKGDSVKIMRGKFKGKKGKIARINHSELKVFIEGINLKKIDGSEKSVAFNSSNLLVTEIEKGDERRFKGKKVPNKKTEKKKVSKTKPKKVKKKTSTKTGVKK